VPGSDPRVARKRKTLARCSARPERADDRELGRRRGPFDIDLRLRGGLRSFHGGPVVDEVLHQLRHRGHRERRTRELEHVTSPFLDEDT
jgi:hypothetical protein